MKAEQPLVDRYLDGELTPEEQGRLTEWLEADAEHIREFVRETSLHRQIREIMLARPYHAYGVAEVERARPKALQSPVRWLPRPWGRLFDFPWSASLRSALILTACLTLLSGLGVWLFRPPMGEPVLAEVQGFGLSLERAGQSIPTVVGMRLQSGDVLRTPSNAMAVIGFAPENTSVKLQPGTESKLAGISHGKHFDLHGGKLEASVARQRPFHPMIISTPQAEARVLGTRFSLLTTTNATRIEVTEGRVRFTRRSDDTAVKVGAGRYAVAAANYELAALPQTGGLLQEWWTGVKGKTRFSLSDDPRFPDHPDARTTVPDFELKLAETNQFAVRICGYVHPPVTGEYRFWLESPPADFAAVGFANLMMSPTEDPSEAVQIAQTGGGGMVSPYVTVGATEAPPHIPLVAGRRYYIEARILIGKGKGELAVAWQPPGQSRRVLSAEFLSPFKPK